MIKQTLSEIEQKIKSSANLDEKKKNELLSLLQSLDSEIRTLSETHTDQANSIVNFTRVSAHEATRAEKNKKLMQLAFDGLDASVDELEKTHPRLVETVNNICVALSNIGI